MLKNLDLTQIYSALILVGVTLFGMATKAFLSWLNSKKLIKQEKLCEQINKTLESVALKGIEVANQKVVDDLKKNGAWNPDKGAIYAQNQRKAMDVAVQASKLLMSKKQITIFESVFGKDKINERIEMVVESLIKKSKKEK